MIARGDASETQRVDALSDGVFAIAMTLLGAELTITPTHTGSLAAALLAAWPSYVSFLMSFITIAIIWVNHHRLFMNIRKVDHTLMMYNGLLLMVTTVLPFVTRVLAEHMTEENERRTATLLYGGILCGLASIFNLLWRHAALGTRLLDHAIEPRLIARINRQYGFGPVFYAVSCGLALVNPWVSLGADFLIAIFFALPVWSLGRALAPQPGARMPGDDEGNAAQ
jgi:uncharacterized membrane protein